MMEQLFSHAVKKQYAGRNPCDAIVMPKVAENSREVLSVEGTRKLLEKARESAEDLDEISLRLSNLYLEQERFEDVVALASEELENVLARWNIAKAYQAIEDTDRALVLFDQLKEDLAENPEFLLDLIEVLRQEGALSEAKIWAGRYLNLVPDDMTMQEFYYQED